MVALAVLFAALLAFPFGNRNAEAGVTALAQSGAALEISDYDVDMTIQSDRKIVVREKITVKFLQSGLSMFYRSLPVDQGDQYFHITASCPGNDAFRYEVANNPDVDGFIDINCIGNAAYGQTWTYYLGYTMISSGNEIKDGMILDVVGAGWPVDLNDVDVSVSFPGKVLSRDVYSGAFGTAGGGKLTQSFDASKNVLTIHADRLKVVYNDTYNERMAEAITVEFTLEAGVLRGYTSSRVFTAKMGVILGIGAGTLAVAIGLYFVFRRKREIIPVVGLKAPRKMDPLQMGKLIDNRVDNEDLTSMIYYFAAQGYLMINMEKADDPVLLRRVKELPDGAPVHQRVLFKGLFSGKDSMPISGLANRFYTSADEARTLVHSKDIPHYEKSTQRVSWICAALAALLFFALPFFTGLTQVGGGYLYFFGLFMAAPVVLVYFLLRGCVDMRYKKKKSSKTGMFVGVLIVIVAATVFYCFFTAKHLLNPYEKLAAAIFAWAALIAGVATISRTKRYNELLGEILGFKEFIVVTSEDKIKFMLEENPELFYELLPYAQVLGVTKEWQDKFRNILLEPPSWYVGSNMTVFDFVILNSIMRRATISMMSRPSSGGSGVGRSGGGGHFGGFSGGGHGGGGGGAR